MQRKGQIQTHSLYRGWLSELNFEGQGDLGAEVGGTVLEVTPDGPPIMGRESLISLTKIEAF